MNTSRRQPIKYALCLLVAVILLGISSFLGQRFTASAQSDGEEPNPIVAAYAHDMKIDYQEAERRLTLQHEMSSVEQEIVKDEAYFASWMQHEPEFGLVVSFTTPDGKERIRPYLEGVKWADLVTVQQSDITREEFAEMRSKIVQEAEKTGIAFGSGLNYRTGQVRLYTEKTDELRAQLEGNDAITSIIDRIELVKESGAAPADYDYPYLLGGHAQSQCTSGFPVYRVNDGVRFISTSGHCDNGLHVQYGGANAVYLGNIEWENNLDGVGPWGDDLDFQVHDAAGARSFDLTNRIETGATATQSVIGTEARDTTIWDYVCKHGKITGQTCGFVDDVNHNPEHDAYGDSDNYVRVFRVGNLGNIACQGDSGSPVYRYWGGGVYGLGVLSGGYGVECTGPNDSTHFFYSPVDYINWSPYRILTTDYPLYFHQNVWWSSTNCLAYQRPLDAWGNPAGAQTSSACQTSLPAGSSGQIRSYTTYVIANQLREAIWRGTNGYVRNVPLNADGTVNWAGAPAWSWCCSNSAPPEAQDVYIVGNTYRQNVWWSASNCIEYSRALDNTGNPSGNQTERTCQTTLPAGSSGSIQTYAVHVTEQYLHEALWRGGRGYVRDVPLNDNNTDVNWAAAPAWHHCCTATAPEAQGAYVLTHP